MKINKLVLAIAALMVAPVTAIAEPDHKMPPKAEAKAKAKLSADEIKIVSHLHHVNLMEIDMAKSALKQGTQAIKSYAEMLQRDHGNADKDLIAFAKKRGIAKIPHAMPKTDVEKEEAKEMKEAMAKLKALKAADFDREYLRLMVAGHEKELAKSDVFLATATDAELKTTLESRKTSLQRHADGARDLQNRGPQAKAPSAPTDKSGSY